MEHACLVLLLALTTQELAPKNFDILLHFDQELDLVLLDSTPDSGACEESVEDLEDTEHLVGILGL
jgi:hypothetical protein